MKILNCSVFSLETGFKSWQFGLGFISHSLGIWTSTRLIPLRGLAQRTDSSNPLETATVRVYLVVVKRLALSRRIIVVCDSSVCVVHTAAETRVMSCCSAAACRGILGRLDLSLNGSLPFPKTTENVSEALKSQSLIIKHSNLEFRR